jgi:hypothetical protein
MIHLRSVLQPGGSFREPADPTGGLVFPVEQAQQAKKLAGFIIRPAILAFLPEIPDLYALKKTRKNYVEIPRNVW